MIRLIGEDPQALKQATCKNCGARLEYTNSEVKSQHGKDYGGGAYGREYIECPRCKHEVVLRSW